jgi:hypothetical protein
MSVEAELKRRNPSGDLVAWQVNDDGSDPVSDAEVRSRIGATTDVEATANGSVVAILKRLRTLLTNIFDRQGDGSAKTQVTNFPADQTVTVTNPTANPETGLAKETTLQAVRDRIGGGGALTTLQQLLEDIKQNTADIELSANNIAIDADAMNLNVDGVESLLTQVRDTVATTTQLTTLIGHAATIASKDFATQATLAQVAEELASKTEPANNQLVHIERLSAKPGRTHRHITGRAITGSTTLATVTAGKTFYVTSVTISVRNTDVVNVGDCALRDNSTVKLPVLLGLAIAGQPAPHAQVGHSFSEPMRFTTDVNWHVANGTTSASITVVGYEE